MASGSVAIPWNKDRHGEDKVRGHLQQLSYEANLATNLLYSILQGIATASYLSFAMTNSELGIATASYPGLRNDEQSTGIAAAS